MAKRFQYRKSSLAPGESRKESEGSMNSANNLMEANVQWRNRPADERYETLSGLKERVNGRRNRTRTADVSINDLHVEEKEGVLVINEKIRPVAPSHWAFGQLATLSGAPAGYLRGLPLDLAANCLNHSIKSVSREALKLMTVRNDDGGMDSLNAVTSVKYGRIWDADCVDAVGRIVERSEGKFYNPKDWTGKPSGLYASDRDCFMFMIDGGSMVDGGGVRDQLNRGFICWNSETGSRTFGLTTFLFRVVCGNHIIWGAEDVTKLIIRHTGSGPARFDREAMPILMDYVNAAAGPVEEQIRRAKKITIADLGPATMKPLDDEWIANFSSQRGFTRGELRDAIRFAQVEEGQCANLWDLVNGFTGSSRSLEFMDARFDLEKRAGSLLSLVE